MEAEADARETLRTEWLRKASVLPLTFLDGCRGSSRANCKVGDNVGPANL